MEFVVGFIILNGVVFGFGCCGWFDDFIGVLNIVGDFYWLCGVVGC